MMEIEDDLLTRMESTLDSLPEYDRQILLYDVENNYEERDKLIKDHYGITQKARRHRFIKAMKKYVKEVTEGTYQGRKCGGRKNQYEMFLEDDK